MFTCGLLFLIFLPHSGPGVCVNGQQSNVSGRNDCEVGKELVVVMSTINILSVLELLVSGFATLLH